MVFSGAGMSAESGIKTFRDSGGLWEDYKIEDVATPEAWNRNPGLVLDFYNMRRKQVIAAKPNEAHLILAKLQQKFEMEIITQNIDDLHERAGSKHVLHLHGEIMKSRSTSDPSLVYTVKTDGIKAGDKCAKGSQLRPHIVWFGEMVPNMETAVAIVQTADIFITIGTSLNVYPAAGLMDAAPKDSRKFLIDPGTFNLGYIDNLSHIQEKAVKGMKIIEKQLNESK